MARFGLKFIYVDMTESENVARVCAEKTKMIWIETPTNPLLKLCDIKKIAANAHVHNPHTCVVVDNTFASPYFQRPLALGAHDARVRAARNTQRRGYFRHPHPPFGGH